MIRHRSLIGAMAIVVAMTTAAGLPASAAERLSGIRQHAYTPGEKLVYWFEDTDYTYEATLKGQAVHPGALVRVQALRARVEIDILDSGRQMRLSEVTYRSGTPPDLPGFEPVTELLSGFPKVFEYRYQTDQQAVSSSQQVFQPFLGQEVGDFVYYKTLDIHTIQSLIDEIDPGMRAGQMTVKRGSDFELPHGTFRHSPHALSFERIDRVSGVRCAYFKSAAMGNIFAVKDRAPLRTNYQSTFYVPLEGEHHGLLLSGEIQETIAFEDEKRPRYVLRQLSMQLQRPEHLTTQLPG